MPEHLLVTIGKERFNEPVHHSVHLVDDKEQNDFLNDIENTPHAYVLGCLMDRQVKAERAWSIPFKIKEIVGSFEIDVLARISLVEFKSIFNINTLHRFNDTMADVFFSAVLDIKAKYDGDASRIWSNNPSSAKVVYEFLQFKGSGRKIATMASNILARQFKILFSDYYSIDISPDVHILRVMRRTGLVSKDADLDSVIYKARELHPEFPGIIDFSCWEIGRTWCRPSNPNCRECIIQTDCEKVIPRIEL
ncbi:MAG: iron-sulfur cluster loop [Clostridia bacterium]|nr:iron-sulfur cluster loop [Clostridia bacterium]